MKGYVGVTLGEGLFRIKLSPKDIGGEVCKRLPKIMSRNVISVKDMP